MSHVQVSNVPTSASPAELTALFRQCGEVRQLVCQYEAGAAEGTALVAFADARSAQEAADLLDAYPLGTSLLEVQPVAADQFVGRLVSRLLAARDPWTGREQAVEAAPAAAPAAAPSAAAGTSWAGGEGTAGGAAGTAGAASVAALEAEMRELQLQLQQQADVIQETAAAAVAQRNQEQRQRWQQQQQQQQYYSDEYGGEEEGWEGYGDHKGYGGEQEGWQEAAPRPRPRRTQQAQPQAQRGGGNRHDEEPNTGLWIGWIDMRVEKADMSRAFSRWGPMTVEHITPADRLADDGKRYKWGIVRYQKLEDAIAAKQATDRRLLPGISTPDHWLKVMYYQPGHHTRAKK